MAHGIITAEQLMHHRHIAQQIINFRKHWKENYSWYPEAQTQQYSRFNDIYKESIAKYGEEEFKKYAVMKRLRGIHTAVIDTRKREAEQKKWCYPMNYMQGIKPSVTTNGDYSLIPPAHHHFCQKHTR
ncbi:uncharacterized protein LOC111603537 [Drosophila hydei]|uniref:Uncharacterized protein LOC111603537 n=1 Tax=Drosophila hydei TaxID=7224 RepID=A0A6J1M9F0_DROHY|nr:uncharacterized protein LOC111603537 [Drosophila hydei]